MNCRSSLFVLTSTLCLILWPWHWRVAVASCGSGDLEELLVWNVSVSSQLELNQFIENVTTNSEKKKSTINYLHLSLAGGKKYLLDIVNLMKISVKGSLIMKGEGGLAEISCTTDRNDSRSDFKKLRQITKPLSCASLVLLDGLIFTGCPVPILIEEASNVVIQNCVFQ